MDQTPAPTGMAEAPPASVGPYRILEKLGEGGMGTVYKAEQLRPVKRIVAIKLIRLGLGTQEVLARFDAERQALARMNHPNVAKVLDASADELGRPYFVMEYVAGKPITQFADQHQLSIKDRLKLFIQVCDAITHAHTKSLLHRDIKAANVLASMEDGKPTAKVIDFGIAKAITGDRLTDQTLNTRQGLAIGSYESMSPEQADGSPDIDTRTDVYSLGVLLYELLTGAKPFDLRSFLKSADAEIKRIIREVDPPKPSTRLSGLTAVEGSTIAAARREQLDVLTRSLRSELEWIPLMAMRKERDRRYTSPRDLAADIQNYLENKPLFAGPDARSYRLKKFIAKRKGPLLAVATVILILTAGVVGTTMGFVGQRKLRIKADQLATEREQARIDATVAKNEAVRQKNTADERLVDALLEKAEAQNANNDGAVARQSFEEARRQAIKCGFPTESADMGLLECESRSPSPIITCHLDGATLAMAPDNRTMISREADLVTLRLWNILTGATSAELRGAARPILCVAFSPDGKWVAAGTDSEFILWSRDGKICIPPMQLGTSTINAIDFSPDGNHIAVAGNRSQITLVDLRTKTVDRAFPPQKGNSATVKYTPDGKTIITTGTAPGQSCNYHLWNAATGTELSHDWTIPSNSSVLQLAVSPDGSRAAGIDWFGKVTIFDPSTGEKIAEQQMLGSSSILHFLPDGKSLLTVMANGSVYRIDASTGEQRVWFTGLDKLPGRIWGGFSIDGDLLWQSSEAKSGDAEAFTGVWSLGAPPAIRPLLTASACMPCMSPQADFLASGEEDGTLNIVDCATARPLLAVGNLPGFVIPAMMPDGRRIVFLINNGKLGVLDLVEKGPPLVIDSHTNRWSSYIAVSPDGHTVATQAAGGGVQLWDLSKNQYLGTLNEPVNWDMGSIAFSPDGKQLQACCSSRRQVWDVSSRKVIARSKIHGVQIWYCRQSGIPLADNRFALIGNSTLGVYNSADATPVWEQGSVYSDHVAASPDSRLLFTAAGDLSISMWNAADGKRIHVFSNVGKAGIHAFVFGAVPRKMAVFDGEKFSFWDLDRMARQRELQARAQKAVEILRTNPNDPQMLLAVGDYLAFRGAWACAAECLESAGKNGATASPLTLARCDWMLGRSSAAVEQFDLAIAQNAADPVYLGLCRYAAGHPPDGPDPRFSAK